MLSRAPVTQIPPATRFRSELGALLSLAIPVVLSELGWMAMSLVDQWVASLGFSVRVLTTSASTSSSGASSDRKRQPFERHVNSSPQRPPQP